MEICHVFFLDVAQIFSSCWDRVMSETFLQTKTDEVIKKRFSLSVRQDGEGVRYFISDMEKSQHSV